MAQTEPNGAVENKKKRAMATVLVAIPGWPTQDPGRQMIWSVRPSPQKAARMVKNLKKKLPEYAWDYEMLTSTEARAVQLRPFTLTQGLAAPTMMRFTGRTWKVEKTS